MLYEIRYEVAGSEGQQLVRAQSDAQSDAQSEGEISSCEPYVRARVDTVTIDGVEYAGPILPPGVTLPGGSNRVMDAGQYLLRPERFPDVSVDARPGGGC